MQSLSKQRVHAKYRAQTSYRANVGFKHKSGSKITPEMLTPKTHPKS